MNDQTLPVHLRERSYDIIVTANSLSRLGAFARQRTKGHTALIVTDENARVHAQPIQQSLDESGFRTTLAVRPAGETQKSIASAAQLYDALVDLTAVEPLVPVRGRFTKWTGKLEIDEENLAKSSCEIECLWSFHTKNTIRTEAISCATNPPRTHS